jgi:PucR C-terminal helix-turn-helix domain
MAWRWSRPVNVRVPENISKGDLARLVPVLHAQLPAILTEVREEFGGDWPEYAEFLGHEQDEVTTAARAFLTWLVELADQPQAPADLSPHIALFESVGRVESREGRELSTLLSAYQVGGRVAWRHVSRAALELGVEPSSLAGLAEAVFVFVDQLSAASARGYVWEQSEAVAERERRREELVDLLLSGRADLAAVRGAAVRAGWALPAQASIIITDSENPIGNTFLSRFDIRSLPVRRPGLIAAIVPDPAGPGRRGSLARALRGARAVVGHAVPLQHLPASVSIAQTAAELQRAGILVDDPVFADEHLDAILVHRDPELLTALQRKVLAPLDAQPSASRERLIETLRSWLRHFGDRRAVAQELHVHPQTVRYRMGQLHTLFGSTLDSPEFRAQLLLALAWSGIPAAPEEPAPSPIAARAPQPRGTGRNSRAQLPPKRAASRR